MTLSERLKQDHRLMDGRAIRDRILDEIAERDRKAAAANRTSKPSS